jgi:acetate kinase
LPNITSHNDAFQHILDSFINDKDLKEVRSKDDITYACHRVVHGGNYTADHFIDTDTYHKIEELKDLAPL